MRFTGAFYHHSVFRKVSLMITIGLDFGTTTISGSVLDIQGARAGTAAEGHPVFQPQLLYAPAVPNDSFLPPDVPGARIQNTEKILSLGQALLEKLLAFCEAETSEPPAAVGLTGQMHGIVYADHAGRPLSPLYTWQDLRGGSVREQILEKTGVSVPAGYGLATHYYNMTHDLVPESAVSLCTIMDLFGMRITGRCRPLMHMTNAASLGFFDTAKKEFTDEALAALFSASDGSGETGSGSDLLIPDFTEEIQVIGSFRGIPVTCAIGDNQAGVLASIGTALGIPLVNFGTGGQVSLLSDCYSELPGIETRPFLPGLYLMAGSSLCGGRAYAILEHFFRSYAADAGAPEEPQYTLMNALAEKALQQEAAESLRSAPGPGDPLSVSPLFCGTRMDPSLRGSVTGISDTNFTPGSLILGTLRGMADELYGYYSGMTSGRPHQIRPKRIVGSGNGLRKNPVLQKLVSGRFGAPLELSPFEEEAACGAAVSAAMGMLRIASSS